MILELLGMAAVSFLAGFFLHMFLARFRATDLAKIHELDISRLQEDGLRSLEEKKKEVENLQLDNMNLTVENAVVKEKLKAETAKIKSEVEIQKELEERFKITASDVLNATAKSISEHNAESVKTIVDPLKKELKEKYDEVANLYKEEHKDRGVTTQKIISEIQRVTELGSQLSKDADNLATTLKGNTKAQGNWGEYVLDTILDKSSLIKGEHYFVQSSSSNDEGQVIRPDVIINLPGPRMIVVDSKVSLTAYNEYVNAETESEREKALQRHLTSVRSHLDGLVGKDYPQYKKGESITLETVLMFVPIEPALNLAFDHDPKLFNSAIEKHICVVSPNNLVATLRILEMVWKAEKLNKNRQKLAETAGQMYAKVEGFLSSFEKIEKSLNQASGAYNDAYTQLTGRNKGKKGETISVLGRLKQMEQLAPTMSDKKKIDDKWFEHEELDENIEIENTGNQDG